MDTVAKKIFMLMHLSIFFCFPLGQYLKVLYLGIGLGIIELISIITKMGDLEIIVSLIFEIFMCDLIYFGMSKHEHPFIIELNKTLAVPSVLNLGLVAGAFQSNSN